ncbi:hypothetical protein [Vibrio sp. WXL103]|uniref:hypothetical protein n=1 Tax=Vibrio sp. WXL103 TaxID=3450710 RepID=UPI003EC8EA96
MDSNNIMGVYLTFISLGLAVLLASTNTFACGFHDVAGALDIPNYPGIMFTLARIKAATDVEMISEMEKPAAMLNWQLAQQLRETMPVEKNKQDTRTKSLPIDSSKPCIGRGEHGIFKVDLL